MTQTPQTYVNFLKVGRKLHMLVTSVHSEKLTIDNLLH